MPLIKLDALPNGDGTETQTVLISSETLFKIAPLTSPPPSLPPDVVPHNRLDPEGLPPRNDEMDYSSREPGIPESFDDYYDRTRNPNARSVVIVRHPQGNGHTSTYYAIPQTVEEIASAQPDLISLSGSPDRPAPAGKHRVMTHDR
jgi:hypothetical protein